MQFFDWDLLTNLQIVERMHEYLLAFDPIYTNVVMPISIWSLYELSNEDVGGIMPDGDEVFYLHPEKPDELPSALQDVPSPIAELLFMFVPLYNAP